MEAIQGNSNYTQAAALQALQGNTNQQTSNSADTAPSSEKSSDDSFMGFLKQVLGKTGTQEVNEEELYLSILASKLNEHSTEAGTFYQQQVEKLTGEMARGDGYVPTEDVARMALKATAEEGLIDVDKAEMIHGEAFMGAQLDTITGALYDGRGDTRAVASADEAMAKLQLFMENLKNGSVTADARSLLAPSNKGPIEIAAAATAASLTHTPAGGTAEASAHEEVSALEGLEENKSRKFSWKHVSDKDGKLAILIPQALSDGIDSVEILDSEGNVIERGKYSKRTGDDRAVYRFQEPGGEYGKDLDVLISYKNGSVATYHIPDGNKRTSEWLDDSPNAAQEKIENSDQGLKDKAEASTTTPATSTASPVPGATASPVPVTNSGGIESGTPTTVSNSDAGASTPAASSEPTASAESSTSSDSSASSDNNSSDIQSPNQVL